MPLLQHLVIILISYDEADDFPIRAFEVLIAGNPDSENSRDRDRT